MLCYAWFWGFHHQVDEKYPVLGHYAANNSNILPKFQEKRGSWPLKFEPIGCPEMSVSNYQESLRNNPEERSSQCCVTSLARGGVFGWGTALQARSTWVRVSVVLLE